MYRGSAGNRASNVAGRYHQKMKSVERNLELRSVTMDRIMCLFASVSLAATSVRIEKTLRASDTDRVPSAESFLPVYGNVSGLR